MTIAELLKQIQEKRQARWVLADTIVYMLTVDTFMDSYMTSKIDEWRELDTASKALSAQLDELLAATEVQ